jgi:hypothetical protein
MRKKLIINFPIPTKVIEGLMKRYEVFNIFKKDDSFKKDIFKKNKIDAILCSPFYVN